MDLSALLALGRAGTGLLAAPRIIAGEDRANQQDRMLMQQLGATPEQIEGIAPRPAITLPGGTLGKILEGVGTTGAIFNAMLGGHVAAPRPDIGEIAAVGNLMYNRREKTAARDALNEAADLFTTPRGRALARAGKTEAAVRDERPPGRQIGGILGGRIERNIGAGMNPDEALEAAITEQDQVVGNRQKAMLDYRVSPGMVAGEAGRAGAVADATGQARQNVLNDPTNVAGAAGRAGAITGAQTDARLDVTLDPANVARSNAAAGARSQAVAEGRRAGEKSGQLGAVNTLMRQLDEAIDRRLTADDVLPRIKQGVGLTLFKQSPGFVGTMMGMSKEQAELLAKDIEVLEAPKSYAGLVIKALGIDSGALAEGDIGRITDRFASKWDAGVVAKAKMSILHQLVDELSGIDPLDRAGAQAAAARAEAAFAAAEAGGDTGAGPASSPASTPSATGAPRTADEYMRKKGLR